MCKIPRRGFSLWFALTSLECLRVLMYQMCFFLLTRAQGVLQIRPPSCSVERQTRLGQWGGKVVFLSTSRKHWLSFHASNAFLVIPFAWWPQCLPGSVGMLPPPSWLFLSFFFWSFSSFFFFFFLILWLIPLPFLVCVQPISMIPFWATQQQTLWMPTSVPVSEHGYIPDLWGGHGFLPFQGSPSQMLPPLSACPHYLLPLPIITQELLSFSAGIPAPVAPPHCTSYQQPAVFSLSCCIFITQPMPLSWELGLTVSCCPRTQPKWDV